MRIPFQPATERDVPDLVLLRVAVNRHLASQFGEGFWVARPTEKGARFEMSRGTVFIARYRTKLIATFTLSTRKPWAIDKKYFHPCKLPLYLTSMAVHPRHQCKGIGRLSIDEARRIAAAWPAEAIRLDAFDVQAGAGDFYQKCGFHEVGRAIYRAAPLIYFELLIGSPPTTG